MSSKPGTRDKLNQWLEQSASAFEHLIRPRSPKPSSTSTSNQQAVQIPDSLVPGSRPVLSSALLNEQPPPARTHPVLSAPKIRTASKTTILDVPILNQGPTARSPSEPTMSNIPTSHVEVAVADVIQPSQLAPGAESSVALVPISPDSKPTPGADDSFSASSLKNTASAALKLSLTAWRESVGAVPTLRSAIDILLSVIENVPTAVKNHKDYNELALSLVATIRSLASQLSQVTPAQMTEAIVDAKKELESQAKHVKARQERAAAKKYIDVEDDIADIIQCYRRIEALFRRLLSDAILSVWRITYQNLSVANESLKLANKNIVELYLSKLNPAHSARYDSDAASRVQRSGCTPDTRQLVLRQLRGWASDPKGAKIHWMNGMAGTGKTTIAYSLCNQLEYANQLAASFFCSRSLPDCRDVARIIPTIAYQLARFCRPFLDTLCQTLESDPDLSKRGVSTQFEKLIIEPIRQVRDKLPDGLLVVVIDALDECTDHTAILLILDSLIHLAASLPLKFFVTCRPDGGLLKRMEGANSLDRLLNHLHDVEQSLVQADIETYLRAKLDSIKPREGQIRLLVQQSGRLFIYAATAVRYVLANGAVAGHQKRLDVILGIGPNTSTKAYGPLDALYTAILAAAFENNDLEDWETEDIRRLVYTIVCAREPLTLAALAWILKMEGVQQVKDTLEPLRSVLHVNNQSEIVSTLHASFSDYMHTQTRSGRFHCDRTVHNTFLAQRCFETMERLLSFNICGFESSFVRDEAVPDFSARVGQAIPLHLFYACRHWSDHMLQAKEASELIASLDDFLRHRVLFWIEVMNVKHETRAGLLMLSDSYTWMKAFSIPDQTRMLCLDAQKFIAIVGANAVCRSTPHIYVSVLALWNRQSPIWRSHGTRMHRLVKARGLAIDHRESAAVAVWKCNNGVFAMGVSSDGRSIASGGQGGDICVRDAHTGDVTLGPLTGYKEDIYCIVFSPDGNFIASGSYDGTIHIWNVRTGQGVLDPLEGHTDSVLSIAYSPDGKHLASGSYDRTIRIWDVQTGHSLVSPLKGHAKGLSSVAYSPDSKRIVSGALDNTILVWDSQTGELIFSPLTGHTSAVLSVAFSPDNSHIASGSSDYTIHLWDACTGDPLDKKFRGHTSDVRCVSYSSDSNRIVSGSSDGTVRVWDVQSGQTIAGPFVGHTNWVYSVAFMPGDDRVVSCCGDHTIRMWDARAICAPPSLSEGHTKEVYSVAFSPDSRYVASCGYDCTVRVWDAQTGKMMAGPFTGHTDYVWSVAFSPCGRLVVSCSSDCTLRIWDMSTGGALTNILEGHTDVVISSAFSPDGSRVVSGSGDCTIRLWDVRSGHVVAGLFTKHTGPVISVAYSSNGERIASCSEDATIRVWDAQTGETIAGPFNSRSAFVAYSSGGAHIMFSHESVISTYDIFTGLVATGLCTGHDQPVLSAAFTSDQHYIVSGSSDDTLRVWDAKTGQTMNGPIYAHTDWVKSVACSSDGRLIASGSHDGGIRIWNSPKLIYAPPQDLSWWTVSKDGWVVGHDSSLLFWIPADLRTVLKWPQNVTVIHQRGDFELEVTGAYIGTEWTKCYVAE